METTIELIAGKRTPVIPLIHAPPFGYSSEPLLGKEFQEKIYLRIVAAEEGTLWYDSSLRAPLHRNPEYFPLGTSRELITGRNIENFLTALMDRYLREKVSPIEARQLNFMLYEKLGRTLPLSPLSNLRV